MVVLTWLYEAFTNLIGWIFPVFGAAAGSKTVRTGLRWLIHALLIAAILVGLHYLGLFLGLHNKLPGVRPEFLRYNWLPLLFLLVYILCWLGGALWRLLYAEEGHPEFPDIQSAWDEVLKALDRAGLDLRAVPLFLVLGRPEGAMDTLFQAARLKWVVKGAPGGDAPVQVWATAEAAYVTCAGASVLGRHATLLSGESEGGGAEIAVGGDDDPGGKTLTPGGAGVEIVEIKGILDGARRQGREPTREERRRIRALMRRDRVQQAPIRNADETGRLTARFEFLCRLLVRDRFPYCPINGVLLLVPFAATDQDQDALDTGATCQYDLATARRVLQVNAPTLALLCDLETAPGFTEFVDRFPEKQRLQRIGQRCPLVPALADDGASRPRAEAEMLISLADWLCGNVVPGWVYKHFEMEQPGRSDAQTTVRGNARLFQFMHDLRQRQRRLGRLLEKAVVTKDQEPILFGGCYLGATGPDSARDQAFVAGVFRRLADEENNVSWTAAALDEEASYSRKIGTCQAAIAVLIVAELALIGLAVWKGSK
jgi:hypothetical protein